MPRSFARCLFGSVISNRLPAQLTPEAMADDQVGPSKKTNRCWQCNKRVGLLGFPCRCGGTFCCEHRYDDMHECPFDYKTVEREELRKNHPVICCEKIQRL
ncbi:hypothetical protein L596_012361 [Steinernema carpocapsae]|uniref:AN1-type domain-containing protein n=1 Tax=Steinernema carpocapsae TaxID=34508 RepID=A0A4U5NXQ0_STECR|nr:hypothetical protein L596_012361 [Steinernema carpocapsae]